MEIARFFHFFPLNLDRGFFLSFFPSGFRFNYENLQVMEACTAATDCGSGLYCGNCPASGHNQPVCTRGQATVPTSVVCFLVDSFFRMEDYSNDPLRFSVILICFYLSLRLD